MDRLLAGKMNEGNVATPRQGELAMNPLKHIFIVGMVFASLAPFLWPLTRIADRPVENSTWAVVLVSAVLNVVTIFYHYVIPPHPKFLMIGWRRAILNVHITGGMVEFVAGLTFLLMGGSEVAGAVMAIAALALHTPTALAQTPLVFGSRAVMRPAYLAATFIHAFCAGMLLAHPGSTYWVVSTFLVFNIYVWCRIYYYVFERYSLFPDSKYSVSILAAGVTALPAVLGPTAMLAIVGAIAAYMALYSAFFVRSRAEFLEFVRERARDSAFEPGVPALWDQTTGAADGAAARRFFAQLDQDKDGKLTSEDLAQGLYTTALPVDIMKRFIQKADGEDVIDFEAFERHFWSIREIRDHAADLEGMRAARSERDKAELVFHRLDLDGDGLLGRAEMDALLNKWAMPPTETRRWLDQLRGPEAAGVDFETFFKKMRPVWRFIYYEIMEATTGQKQDMLGRAMAARRADVKTREVRQDVRRELVGGLSFLKGVDATFLDELAESLVEEECPVGSRLIEEGAAGDTCWIVRSGRLRVSRGGEILGDLGPGDWLGEGALLTDAPRLATAEVTAPARLYAITRPSFGYLVGRNPQMMANLKQIHEERRLQLMRRVVHERLVRQVSFLRDADAAFLDALAHDLRSHTFPDGHPLFLQGAVGDRMYFITRGAVKITRDQALVAELPAGGYFGEMALLTSQPRSASATAVGVTELLELDRAGFDRLVGAHPAVHAQLEKVRQARADELLSVSA